MFLLVVAAVGVVGVVYVTGHRFSAERQNQVKQLAVMALAALGFLFAVVFSRGFLRGAVSAAVIVVTLAGMGGGATFVWMRLAPPGPRGHDVKPVSAPASKSRVVVRSEPPGAIVIVDGTPFAKTPASFILPNGKYEVTVHLDGYADWTETVTVSEERTLDVKLQAQ